MGNHGNEGLPHEGDASRLTRICRGWRAGLELQLLAPEAEGVWVEDKGVHWSRFVELSTV